MEREGEGGRERGGEREREMRDRKKGERGGREEKDSCKKG